MFIPVPKEKRMWNIQIKKVLNIKEKHCRKLVFIHIIKNKPIT